MEGPQEGLSGQPQVQSMTGEDRLGTPPASTSEWPRLAKAPIIEALLDIRAQPETGIGLDRLAAFHTEVRDRYPRSQERQSWAGNLRFGPSGVSTTDERKGPDGYLFTSADKKQVVQARLDGFTFNRLRPYESWERFQGEARELWTLYCRIARPTVVSRVALRFINRIELPLTLADFREYILTTAEVAPGLPQGLSAFFMRLEIPLQEAGCVAIVTETMEKPEGTLPFILDIDVVREEMMDPNGAALWEAFERLRHAKNTVFFRSLTLRAQELCQ